MALAVLSGCGKQESETFIEKTVFENILSFNVTSSNVKKGVWDEKITNTERGENISPELSWDAVDGASGNVIAYGRLDGDYTHKD